MALAANLLIIAVYHLGYPEFRGPRVMLVVIGAVIGIPLVIILGLSSFPMLLPASRVIRPDAAARLAIIRERSIMCAR